MDPPRPHVLVEGEGVRGCPQLTTQPIFPEVDYGGDSPLGMPYAGTPSLNSFDPSHQFSQSLKTASFTTPDGLRGSSASSPAYPPADALEGNMDLTKDATSISGVGSWLRLGPEATFSSMLEDLAPDQCDPELPQLPSGQDVSRPLMAQSAMEDQLTDPRMSELRQAVLDVYETITLIDSNVEECSKARLLQTLKHLHEIDDYISSMLQLVNKPDAVMPPGEMPPPPPPSHSSAGPRSSFKCPKCDKRRNQSWRDRGSFTRHVNDMHHPRAKYRCPEPDCPKVVFRRHKISDHINRAHHRFPKPGEIEEHAEPVPFEPICSICRFQVRSWDEFYRCFVKHCTIQAPPSTGSSSRRPSTDHSIGDTDDGSSDRQVARSSAIGNPSLIQQYNCNNIEQWQPQSRSGATQGSSNHIARPNTLAGPQFTPSGQHRRTARSPSSWANTSHDPGISRHLTPGESFRRPQPPNQWPGTSLNPFGTRHRTRRAAPGSHHRPRCQSCGHSFRDCRFCQNLRESRNGCHACPDLSAVRASSPALPETDVPGSTSTPGMTYFQTINPGHLHQPGPGFDPIAPGHVPSDPRAPEFNYPREDLFNSMGQMTPTIMDAPWTPYRGNNVQLRAVLSIDENVLSEQEMVYSSGLDFKAPPTTDVLTSILPLMDPFKKWLYTPLKGLSTLTLSGLDFITATEEPPAVITKPNLPIECQTLCRARARAELAPGRRVELSLELSPPDNSKHAETHGAHSQSLRTRVQIVVKLLMLRSSVNTSKKNEATKLALGQAFEPTLGESVPNDPDNESEDSDDSDTESVFSEDELSISSSCSDLQSLSLDRPTSPTCSDTSLFDVMDPSRRVEDTRGREEEVSVMFNFDLQSALGKLSQWSGGSSGDIYSELLITDPSRVMEYFAAYVLYVIMTLTRSGEHISGPRWDQ